MFDKSKNIIKKLIDQYDKDQTTKINNEAEKAFREQLERKQGNKKQLQR